MSRGRCREFRDLRRVRAGPFRIGRSFDDDDDVDGWAEQMVLRVNTAMTALVLMTRTGRALGSRAPTTSNDVCVSRA
eukprot:1999989-Prymnesium_polylepis.1